MDISVDYAKSISKRVERVISSDNVALCFSTLYLSSFPLDTLLCTFSLLYVFHKNCSQVWNKNNSDFFVIGCMIIQFDSIYVCGLYDLVPFNIIIYFGIE